MESIQKTQANTQNIRNICILAHVDHGKTTLSDYLICSNGIISSSLAGKVRYMDSREDEQEKGITMKSSCISLSFKKNSQEYLINLIDSPGHVDFSSEVSTASRLTDGGVVLVDVVEGVCIQTRSVLQQAFKENIKPCLVLNKIDRLILEKQLSPLEAFKQMTRILEHVNVLMSTFKAAEAFRDAEGTVVDTEIDSESFFSAQKGNVAFASAIDGWAFRIKDFAKLFSKKFGMSEEVLQEALWGNHYLTPKKEIKKKPVKQDQEPMFVQFILNNIYDIYNAFHLYKDYDKAEKILTTFKLPASILKKPDTRGQVKTVMSSFLPLPDTVLSMVVDTLPNPIEAQRTKVSKLIPELENKKTKETQSEKVEKGAIRNYRRKLKKNLYQCDKSEGAEVMVYVSKMLEVDELPGMNIQRQPRVASAFTREMLESMDDPAEEEGATTKEPEAEPEKQNFVGFCRIFSGTIKLGQKLHILGPRYNPMNPNKHRNEFTVSHLYVLMGRNLEAVSEVPAGNVFGIGGVSQYILKSATIASSAYAPIFSSMYMLAAPIVRIAIEPKNLQDMPKLVKGLKLLNQADPAVEVYVQETGEHVIMTAGEIHAERCLRDLQEKMAKVPILASAPLVNFRETIIKAENTPAIVTHYTANRVCKISIRAIPLPENIANFIDQNKDQLKKVTSKKVDAEFVSYRELDELKEEFVKAGWEKEWDNVWALGPKHYGPNILLNHIKEYQAPHFRSIVQRITEQEVAYAGENAQTEFLIKNLQSFDSSITAGFQLAASSGPLCDEPMMGVCFCVEDISFEEKEASENSESFGTFGGQIISTIKEACRKAFDLSPRRLIEAMYKCEVQATQNTLGQVYAVLRKRRAKVVDEVIIEGTELFSISCLLPVVESFGFTDELRTKTSGQASPQLIFSHWQILDVDPFYIPTTEEEIEEHGEGEMAAPNIAKDYINKVRERKGLLVKKKIVEFANKQRTLSTKK